MAVLNKRAVVSAIEMYGVSSIRLPKVLGESFAALIKSLFANSEQGFVYDPNDLTTMYQDAAGTVPVTGAGQPVGLVLDKSKGLIRGVEKWIDSSVALVGSSSKVSLGTYRIYTSDGTYSAAQIFGALTVGRMYEISFEITSIASAGGGIIFDGSPTLVFSTVGKKRHIITATSPTLVLKRADVLLTDYTVTNISVREIMGNHAYQTTSASRPILRENATTGAYYLEFDGSDDFLVTNSIDFTSTDKISLFAGVRKLSDVASIIAELGLSANANNGTFAMLANTAANAFTMRKRGSGSPNPLVDAIATPFTTQTPAVLSSGVNFSVTGVVLRANSNTFESSADSGVIAQSVNAPIYIGRRAGTSLPFNGHIYSLIGVGRLSTDDEIASIEKELAKRTGVTLSV